ncbi:hypothetical protein TVAG_247850 [Trichomonas vaginalis G3]|uniref:Leucine Rich Repeat family protein n=1 Tax=Trichomonas vaginalis (strain ATCC PRA-98 / G3) TaxID=412133 RepID=A2GNW7_TRIV3|nr:ribonuclease inhibitor domain-containing protein [Trichomonas vaginalis G3]EAX81150.1 hypothetical protein TVAG_247850 [Trichomonas vaginalis G3]KAI5498495.1 ribonuclease inhibitor domain-containing protein [Trichomonas vaginalis G3]|eukprot:XP_001294080.1 hypothetical protein [Trichomonas vaginalis G3]
MKGPQWLTQRELSFKRTGIINITGVNVDSLAPIGSRSHLKELNMSRSKLESIETLRKQPSIQKFIADNSQINTWKNFKAISNATCISLKNTPLSQPKYFPVAARVLFGDNLKVLNGKAISNVTIERAKTYPAFVSDLLNAGWEFVFPCPDIDTLKAACEQYNIECEEEEVIEAQNSVSEREISNISEVGADEHYMDVLCSLLVDHSHNLDEYEAKFDLLVGRYALAGGSELFQIQLKQLLQKYSFDFDEESPLDQQLENAVRSLCSLPEESN